MEEDDGTKWFDTMVVVTMVMVSERRAGPLKNLGRRALIKRTWKSCGRRRARSLPRLVLHFEHPLTLSTLSWARHQCGLFFSGILFECLECLWFWHEGWGGFAFLYGDTAHFFGRCIPPSNIFDVPTLGTTILFPHRWLDQTHTSAFIKYQNRILYLDQCGPEYCISILSLQRRM